MSIYFTTIQSSDWLASPEFDFSLPQNFLPRELAALGAKSSEVWHRTENDLFYKIRPISKTTSFSESEEVETKRCEVLF
jgi:hypothetical protein